VSVRERLRVWIPLVRPWSFAATAVPFLLAAAFWWNKDSACRLQGVLALVSGIFLQAAVNLFNTWGDERSGVDDVPGVFRTTPQVHDGLVSLRAVGYAGCFALVAAVLFGLAASFYVRDDLLRFNFPLVCCGLIGVFGVLNYATGLCLKYKALGLPLVALLMGPVELFAALQAFYPIPVGLRELPGLVFFLLLASSPVASLVAVIMFGNEMRDIEADRAAGIRTAAGLLGPKGSLGLFTALHVFPYVVPALALLYCPHPVLFLFALPAVFSFLALRRAWRVYGETPSGSVPPWRGLERLSGAVHLAFGIAYAGLGIAYAGLVHVF